MNSFVKNLSISKKLAIIIGVFCIIILILLAFAAFGFKFISILRASVGGEDLWSKGRRDAVFYLNRYLTSHDEKDYEMFKVRIMIPRYYTQARNEILSDHTNYDIVYQGFVKGGIDPADAQFVGYLFKYAQPIGYVKEAFAYWGDGTRLVEDTVALGDKIHQKVSSGTATKQDLESFSKELIAVNEKTTTAEVGFGYILGVTSRWAEGLLFKIMVGLTLLFLGAAMYISYSISKYLYTEINLLRERAGKIAAGDFSNIDFALAASSKDEVGQLAKSFGIMAHDLKESYTNLEQKVAERTKELSEAKLNIEEKNKSLEEALSVKNDFIRIVNHQLNTPLSIMNNAYLMSQEKLLTSKKAIEYWGLGLKQLKHVVQDFWNVLESEEGIRSNIQKTNIQKIVQEAVADKKEALMEDKEHLKIIIQKPTTDIPLVFCDPQQITNVMYNLLDNAVFYTQKGNITVSFAVGSESDYLTVSVADTGIGFSKPDKEKLAQKFYRTKQAMLTHPDGSGLGLYICKKLVEINRGSLMFDSEGPGEGSRFSFTLPIVK